MSIDEPGALTAATHDFFEKLQRQKRHDPVCPDGECADRADCLGYEEDEIYGDEEYSL